MLRRLRRWGAAPIVVPRWMLTAKYALFVALGVAAAVAGIPTLSLTTWEGYTLLWGGGVAVSAGVAAAASVRVVWEPVERWGVTALACILTAYSGAALYLAIGEGDSDRLSFAIVLVIINLLPAVRAGQLISRIGRADG